MFSIIYMFDITYSTCGNIRASRKLLSIRFAAKKVPMELKLFMCITSVGRTFAIGKKNYGNVSWRVCKLKSNLTIIVCMHIRVWINRLYR